MKKILILLLSCAVLSGCATMPTREKIEQLDYGTPLSIDYEQAVKQYCDDVLIDPYSAVYKFSLPQQYWINQVIDYPVGLEAGYMVFVDINSKNRMGGYVGKKRWGFLFRNNSIVRVIDPDSGWYGIVSHGKRRD